MRVFFDKRFLLVVVVLLISFVTLVYSQIAFEGEKKTKKNKISNQQIVADLEKNKENLVSSKELVAQNSSESDTGDIDTAQDNEIVLSQNNIEDEDIDFNEDELEDQEPEDEDSLEEDIDRIEERLSEIEDGISDENSIDEDNEESAEDDVEDEIVEEDDDENDDEESDKNGKDKKPAPVSDPVKAESKTAATQTENSQNKPTINEDIVNLQSEMELKDLIQTMSEITSDTFILDDAVKGQKVTIITPTGGFKKQNALRLFETLLDINGFTIVKNNGVNKVVQKKDIKSETLPTQFGVVSSESSDRFVTRLIPLDNVRADDISNAISSLVSRDGDLVVYPDTNTLIIIDSIDNINRIVDIIDNLDVEKKIEFVKIENAEAGDVAAKLLDIFSSGGSGTRSTSSSRSTRTTTSGNRRTSAANRNQQNEEAPSVSGEASSLNFKVITEERTNSLIIIAYPKDLSKIKQVISILDVETDLIEEGIYVVRIQNADAEQLVGVLSSLLGGGGSTGGQSSSRQTIQTGTSGLGTGTGSLGSGGLGQTRQAISRDIGSGGISAVVASTDGLRITADPATNSVIIVGSRKDYETIKEVIDELDVRRRQVFVEAAILEVNLDAIDSLGANFSLGFTVNGDTLGFGGQNLPGIPSLLGIAADTDSAVNLVGSLSGLFLGVVGEQVDPDGSGPIPPIPSFTALFQALTSVTDVNVLSTPSIITTDNEQAEIVVADVIPFPTGSTVGNAGVTVQTIERLPVGIRLAITPQIGEGDYLNLNIVTEVSSTTAAPTGLNTAAFGIATSTRSADSSVVVKNGQTLVIGGLVQDRESIVQNKTPLLGDIPFIGNLFKVQTKESNKLNLMILLTPRIIEDDRDVRDILEEQQKRKMLLQERGLNIIERN